MAGISETRSADFPLELLEIAAQLIWWQAPGVTLENRPRFIAQLMRFGTWREVQTVKGFYGWEPFRAVLYDAPPGLFDERSWDYWHGFFGLPIAELPIRKCFADLPEKDRRAIREFSHLRVREGFDSTVKHSS